MPKLSASPLEIKITEEQKCKEINLLSDYILRALATWKTWRKWIEGISWRNFCVLFQLVENTRTTLSSLFSSIHSPSPSKENKSVITTPLTLATAPRPRDRGQSSPGRAVWKEGTYLRSEVASLNPVHRAAVDIPGHGTPQCSVRRSEEVPGFEGL